MTDQLIAEIDRLRAAMQKAADYMDSFGSGNHAVDILRRALSDTSLKVSE